MELSDVARLGAAAVVTMMGWYLVKLSGQRVLGPFGQALAGPLGLITIVAGGLMAVAVLAA